MNGLNGVLGYIFHLFMKWPILVLIMAGIIFLENYEVSGKYGNDNPYIMVKSQASDLLALPQTVKTSCEEGVVDCTDALIAYCLDCTSSGFDKTTTWFQAQDITDTLINAGTFIRVKFMELSRRLFQFQETKKEELKTWVGVLVYSSGPF